MAGQMQVKKGGQGKGGGQKAGGTWPLRASGCELEGWRRANIK